MWGGFYMSYLYDKLKEALGGDKLTDSRSNIINDWTPNGLKMIIIGTECIITVNHLGVFGGCTKKVDLDPNLLIQDIEEMSRGYSNVPKLNSLLSKRSFSCLEEIYVDKAYMNYPRVINIVEYVKDLMSVSTSRMRYFGYGEFDYWGLREYLDKAFLEAYRNKNYDYSFAEDENRPAKLDYRSVVNKYWYKKYYLRPQFYSKDKQGGDLDIHFKKIEDGYESYLKAKKGLAEKESAKSELMEIIKKDENNIPYLEKIDKMMRFLASSDDKVVKMVFGCVKEVLKEDRSVAGFTKGLITISNGYLLGCYDKYKIYDTSKDDDKKLELGKYKEGNDGFIPIDKILDSICCKVAQELNRSHKDVLGMAILSNSGVPRDSNLSSLYFKGRRKDGNYKGYLDFLGDIIGYDIVNA